MTQEQIAFLIQLLKQGGGGLLSQNQQPQIQPSGGLLGPMLLSGDPRTKYTGTATVGTRG